jgi:hypothetical protein
MIDEFNMTSEDYESMTQAYRAIRDRFQLLSRGSEVPGPLKDLAERADEFVNTVEKETWNDFCTTESIRDAFDDVAEHCMNKCEVYIRSLALRGGNPPTCLVRGSSKCGPFCTNYQDSSGITKITGSSDYLYQEEEDCW